PALVRHRSRDVERRVSFTGEELCDPLLAPDVAAVLVRPLGPARLVGVDDLEAAPLELGERRRLADTRHAGDEDPAHSRRLGIAVVTVSLRSLDTAVRIRP